MNCQPVKWSLSIPNSHRTTEAQVCVPPDIRPPLHCMAPPMWGEMPENLRSDCWNILLPLLLETLVMSEHVVMEAICWPVPYWSLSNSDILFLRCKSRVSETQWVLLVAVGSGFCTFFVLRKRPPVPLVLFNAWRCRDSWRYGCIRLRGMQISKVQLFLFMFI